ncbi:hypothetical protein PICSAR104_03976 [Mycobacterium avium subsp. paratuberculosis]|nr:hypothetical protein PICSAR104_03976 [Mycobacterium avium subsp. paratuberculosis]
MTSLSTPLSSVAENSSRWPSLGVAARIRVTPGRKPRSAMWSASSITVTRTASRVIKRCRIRSSSRPGQATTMSTPAFSAVTWRCCETPPKIVLTRRPHAAANGSSVAVICVASSRVGASTKPVGRAGRRFPVDSRPTSGIEKASVLPLPVFPRPSTSRPARVSGRVSAWMGNGLVIPRAVSASTIRAGTPRSAKVLGVVTFRCLSGSTGWETRTSRGPARGGEIAGWQNRSPRDKPVRDARIIRVPGAVYGAGTGGMRNFPRRVGGSCQCS